MRRLLRNLAARAGFTGARPAIDRNFFEPLLALNRPLKIVGLGDSIMAGDAEPAGESRNAQWLRSATLYSDGRLISTNGYGYGGLSATGHRGVGYKDAYLDCNPDIVVYHLGHNDDTTIIGSGYLTTRASIIATITEAIAAGAKVIVPELVPLAGKTVNQYIGYAAHNVWLSTLPNLFPGDVAFMPGFANLYDPIAPTYTSDGVHPNKRGQEELAQRFHQYLWPQLKKVRTLRSMIVAAGATGRLYVRGDPVVSLPLCGTMGGGYGGGFSESLNTSSGLPSGGNSVIVSANGDGSAIGAWAGPSGSYADKWILYSIRVKANLMSTIGTGGRSIAFGGASNDQGGLLHWGPINTKNRWCHLTLLRKAGPAAASCYIQIFNAEQFTANTNATGSFEIAEVCIHDADAFAIAAGVAGGFGF